MLDNMSIQIKNLSYRVGNRFILKDINWEIKSGERWLLFGMNGCGKTTLLSIIAGFNHGFSGELKILGKTYCDGNILNLRKKIGWISASFFDKLYNSEKVMDIVLSGLSGTVGRVFDIENSQIIKAWQLLELLGVEDKAEMPFSSLSKGERQNVLIARAMISEPEILILDEPGTGLDIYARERMLKMVNHLALKNNVTIVYVTHYPEEILPIFDNCVLMVDGEFCKVGKTKELFNENTMSEFINHKVSVKNYENRYFLAIEDENEAIR